MKSGRALTRIIQGELSKLSGTAIGLCLICRQKSTTDAETLLTMEELTAKLAKKMGVEMGFTPVPPSRTHLLQYLPKSQNELPPRTMKDSFLVGLIPLSSNPKLQDKYTTFLGSLRVGRLLEDMDMFAVMVCEKHIENPKLPKGTPLPQTLVTVCVDRIDFTGYNPNLKADVKISGHVTWVGKSTMEVIVWLAQKSHESWQQITKAIFLIAARDATNSKAAIVNPLTLNSEKEKKIFADGTQRKDNRQLSDKLHVFRALPSNEEQKIVHDLYLKTKLYKDRSKGDVVLPPGGAWMADWTMYNTIFSQPENRNLHNTVFGGFIMRQATELSWVLGFKFTRYRPRCKTISDIKFNKPIAVNALIHMYAFVVFTHLQFVQITVFVEIFELQTGVTDVSNVVYYTYEVPELVREVYPKTYHESMMYIDGRRHFLQIMKPGYEDNETLLDQEGNFLKKI